MPKRLYVFSSGRLRRQQNTLVVETKEGRKYFPVEQVEEIHIFGEIELNKRLLSFLTQQQIPMHFYNRYGYYMGTYYPREHYNSGYMILKQVEHYLDQTKRIDLARRFVRGALQNLLQVLRYYCNRGLEAELSPIAQAIEGHMARLHELSAVEQLMQAEGQAREAYYRAFDVILQDEDFSFGERSRRPPRNRLNSLLSFGNTLLYTTALGEIYKTHLDPRIGFLHATNFRRFTLNLDIAEVFKPILVDRLILSLVQKGQIKAGHFERELEGLYLKDWAQRKFIEEWEKRLATTILHRGLKRNVSYRTLIRLELYKLEKHLIGEREYEPFRSRW